MLMKCSRVSAILSHVIFRGMEFLARNKNTSNCCCCVSVCVFRFFEQRKLKIKVGTALSIVHPGQSPRLIYQKTHGRKTTENCTHSYANLPSQREYSTHCIRTKNTEVVTRDAPDMLTHTKERPDARPFRVENDVLKVLLWYVPNDLHSSGACTTRVTAIATNIPRYFADN